MGHQRQDEFRPSAVLSCLLPRERGPSQLGLFVSGALAAALLSGIAACRSSDDDDGAEDVDVVDVATDVDADEPSDDVVALEVDIAPPDVPEDVEDEEVPDVPPLEPCDAQCSHIAGCAETTPPEDDLDACVDECRDDIARAPDGCGEAHATFVACFTTLSCEELQATDPTDPAAPCHAEFDAYIDACLEAALSTCRPLGEFGDECATSDHCAAGTWCNPEFGVCAGAPIGGEACADGVRCASGLACSLASGECGPMPAAGEPCGLGPLGPTVCGLELGCIPDPAGESPGICGGIPGEDEPCTLDDRCEPGLGCDFSPEGSICRPLRGAGDPCEADHICGPGLYCEFSLLVCRRHLIFGEPCEDGNECGLGGSCMPRTPTEFVCTPMPTEGEACFVECVDGVYCGP